VQGGPADGDATQHNRLEQGGRIDRPGAPNVEFDREDHRRLLEGRKLEGDRPAWLARDRAQFDLEVEAVDLDDRAIDLEVETVASGQPVLASSPDRVGVGAAARVGHDRQAKRAQRSTRPSGCAVHPASAPSA
jgi:hypothetical protein